MTYKREWWRVGATAIAIALMAFVLAVPASAQEQVGAITGKVTDSSGAVLPGATVEAASAGGTRLSTTTGSNGEYRFPRVPPGVYTVTAKLDGFNPAEVQNVSVTLGSTVTANVGLEIGAVTETISVVGDAGQIDVKGSATAASITSEQIELLPKGRDFTGVATQAAGVAQEGFLGGLSVDGASGSENRFVIDGIDTTHPQDGVSGQNLVTDFIEEVQVKSAGYQAEYGGSIGGVVNAVTKSGTNEFKGWVGAYYGESGWNGDERATPYRSSPTLYRTFDKDDVKTTEPGFAIGGPIVQDSAWFYVGYTYTEADIDRTPDGSSITSNRKDKREYLSGNIKGNVGSQFLYKVSANLAPRKIDGNLPNKDGSTSPLADLSVVTKFPTESYSAYADYIPSDNFYLSGRVGFYSTDSSDSGLEATEQVFFRNREYPIQNSPLYRPAGFTSFPGNSNINEDLWERKAASLDGNLFVNGLGSHALKAGVQSEDISNSVSRGEAVNLMTFRWGLADRFGAGVQGTYGSLGVRRFRTEGAADSKNLGLYIQDSWSVLPNFTVNLGVRTEKEEVPNYGAKVDPTLPKNAIEFGYGDKLAPRVGFAWDVFSDQKLKVYGSYGTYYDITKLEMPRGSFGGDKWLEYLFPLETLDWVGLIAQGNCHPSTNVASDNPCPGLGSPEIVLDLRHPTDPKDAIDPDLKPMEQEEYQIGADWQWTTNSVLGVRYVNKSLKNTIEDIGYLVTNPVTGVREETYITGNPGKGVVAGDPDGAGPIPAQPEALRDYEAIELSWNRRFADNYSLRIGYTYSKLEGTYSGLASSDEFGRTDPNVSRAFDALHNAFDLNGRLTYGELNTDRPHQVDAQFIYRFGWGTTVGVNQYYGSGTPISTQWNYIGVPFFPFGRGNAGSTDSLTQTDLLVTHPFKIGDFTLEASVNILNLFDEDAALLIDNNQYEGDLCDADACDGSYDYFFGGGLDPSVLAGTENPFYLKPNTGVSFGNPFQQARTVRVGLKFLF
ncbi:MAG: TonB-dependent receptor [Thermoanaerobaculia bacterium]